MRPSKYQIEEGIKSTGKYRQEDGYSLSVHQAYVDGWYDAIEIMNEKLFSAEKITEEELNNISCKWYGAGHELKVGDKVRDGFTINYANLNGTPSSEYNPKEISLSLKLFVEIDGILYELYKKLES
jgi:hypothetical protein